MTHTFRCTHCDQKIESEADVTGTPVTCPVCGEEFTAPRPDTAQQRETPAVGVAPGGAVRPRGIGVNTIIGGIVALGVWALVLQNAGIIPPLRSNDGQQVVVTNPVRIAGDVDIGNRVRVTGEVDVRNPVTVTGEVDIGNSVYVENRVEVAGEVKVTSSVLDPVIVRVRD